jgi:hypothetical protein
VRGYRCGRRIEVGRHGETRKAKADGETRPQAQEGKKKEGIERKPGE